jgi:hypothetical protein
METRCAIVPGGALMVKVGPAPFDVAPSPTPPRERGRIAALFLVFAGFYLLFGSGHFYATDEETVYSLTESIVERHTLAMPEGAWGLATSGGQDGRQYAVTGPAQSILAVPLYLLGAASEPLLPGEVRGYATRFAVSLFNPLITAATVALLYALACRLGARRGAALGLAVIYGLATTAWPHGRTFFAEPLTAFLLLLALYGFRRGTEGASGWGWLAGGSAALIVALAAKPHAALAVPFLGLYLLARATELHVAGRNVRLDWRLVLPRVLAAAIGALCAVVPLGLYNFTLFGHPLRTGYGGQSAEGLFVTPFLTGFSGLTISSGKGLFWYSPPIVLAALGWWTFTRRWRAEGLLCLALVVAHFSFYSQVFAWHGDGSWGPRYLMVMLPFGILPAIAFLEGVRARPLRLAIASVVVACGIVVQLLGSAVNFDWYILRSNQAERHFSPAASPILAHARYLGERVGLWRERLWPPADSAVLINGFAAAEPPPGRPTERPGLFPRWTFGEGTIALHPAARDSLTVKLTFFDHRPLAARTDKPAILINGASVDAAAIAREDLTGDGGGWIYQFTVPSAAIVDGGVTVTLQSATWNPQQAGQGDRDELLGIFVHNVEVWQGGRPLTVLEALPIDPMPQTPRQRFWWHNDDRNYWETREHLVDHWLWYLAVAGFPRGAALAWASLYGGGAALLLLAGVLLGRRYLPARRRQRPAARKRRTAARGDVVARVGRRAG